MDEPAVTLPALSFMIDKLDRAFMASDAVSLQYLLTVSTQSNPFRNTAGVEKYHIFQSVYCLPYIVDSYIPLRQVAVHAQFSPVRSHVRP
jgi:hypothetical protein